MVTMVFTQLTVTLWLLEIFFMLCFVVYFDFLSGRFSLVVPELK